MKSQRADHEGDRSQDSTSQSAKKKGVNRTTKTLSRKKENENNPERLAGSTKRASAKVWPLQQGDALSEVDVKTHIAKRAYDCMNNGGGNTGMTLRTGHRRQGRSSIRNTRSKRGEWR